MFRDLFTVLETALIASVVAARTASRGKLAKDRDKRHARCRVFSLLAISSRDLDSLADAGMLWQVKGSEMGCRTGLRSAH